MESDYRIDVLPVNLLRFCFQLVLRDQLHPQSLLISVTALIALSIVKPRYSSFCAFSASTTSTDVTWIPLIVGPIIPWAIVKASSGVDASFTPPSFPSSCDQNLSLDDDGSSNIDRRLPLPVEEFDTETPEEEVYLSLRKAVSLDIHESSIGMISSFDLVENLNP